MEILKINENSEREKAINLCKNLIAKRSLVPIIGAGFSYDTPTDNNGAIPSSSDLHDELFRLTEKYSGYSKEELDDIKKYSLSDISKVFWRIHDRIPHDALKQFDHYIQKNFTCVSFQKEYQKALLDVHWPQVFSLNYDTLIEDYNDRYYPIIPYSRINKQYYEEKLRLYKLHGDAIKFLKSGESRYLILSKDQYVESLLNEENEDMLNELRNAFSSKSILFFGCGLTDELDLLYASQLAIKERVRSIDPVYQAVIYINFENNDSIDSDFPARKKDILTEYGVTHVFRISSEQQSTDFFRVLANAAALLIDPSINDTLEKYSSIQYKVLKADDINSREYLFQESLIWKNIDDHMITLPGYHVSRTKVKDIIKCILSKEPLCFISGNFYSGKTFALLETAKHFTTQKVYIFPSGISLTEAQLDALLNKKEALFFFDARSLTTAQIKSISREKELDRISANGSCFVVVIEATDAPMYKYIFEAKDALREFKQFRISGSLNSQEEPSFNKNIGMISLPPYHKGDTILDYVVHNEKELIKGSSTDNYFLEPQKELLAKNQKKRIKALVMLATEIRIPAMRAIQFNIDGAINDMIKCCRRSKGTSVIEKDFSAYCGDSSGYEFVCNSKYWIIRALSAYASTQSHGIDVIADAYLSIIQDYRQIYKGNDVKFYQNSEPYYFFDHIQILFNHHWFSNSSKLVNAIYDKLLPVLADSFQFLHQKAKGKLIIAQTQMKNKNYDEGKRNLDDALANISRAIGLANLYPDAKYIDETLLHMMYTKGRILIEYSCESFYRVPKAVDACYDLYEAQQRFRHDVYDFVNGGGSDKKSFEKFKSILLNNKFVRSFPDLDKRKTEYLLSLWCERKITIS